MTSLKLVCAAAPNARLMFMPTRLTVDLTTWLEALAEVGAEAESTAPAKLVPLEKLKLVGVSENVLPLIICDVDAAQVTETRPWSVSAIPCGVCGAVAAEVVKLPGYVLLGVGAGCGIAIL
jgi:uncharacterized protein YbcC (UPF0753/DUF2309 family)